MMRVYIAMKAAKRIIGIWIKKPIKLYRDGFGRVLKYWIMGNKIKLGFVVKIMVFGESMQGK
jgi:hypothetical protein